MLIVIENLAPHRLGRPDAHGVGMFGRLVRHARRVQTTEDNLRSAALPALGQLVGPAGR